MNLKNVTPVLTGSISDTSKAYASSTGTTGSDNPWRAFDNVENTAWSSGVRTKSAWLEILIDKETTVDYIKVVNRDTVRLPKQILVYGSNDRATYDLIHTTPVLTVNEYPLLIKIPRSTYKCFRLSFPESLNTSTSNYDHYFKIADVYLYEDLDYIYMSQRIKKEVDERLKANKFISNIVTATIKEE